MNHDPTLDSKMQFSLNSKPQGGESNRECSNESCRSDRERRTGIDRRRFSYTLYVPERRGGGERRNASDLPGSTGP